MEREIGFSYPTLRARLNEVIRQMGFPVGSELAITEEERRRVLDDLASGKITSEEAMRTLEGG
jgi:hypothetical protein